MRIDTNTDPEAAAADWTRSRGSEVRREELQRLVNFCTSRSTRVQVRLRPAQAACRPSDDRDGYVIYVPTRKYEQVHTDLNPNRWDRAMQVTFLFHELGHVLYSAFDVFYDYQESIDPRWTDVFKMVYNAAEDVAIEAQLAEEFRLRSDLMLKNATLDSIGDLKHVQYVELFDHTEDGEPVRTYTVYEAIRQGILGGGIGTSDRFARILDPDDTTHVVKDGQRDVVATLEPHLQTYLSDMLAEPDPAQRVKRAFAFFERVQNELRSLPPLQRRRLQTPVIRPIDVHPTPDWSADRADALDPSSDRAGSESDTDTTEGGTWEDEPTPAELRRAAQNRSAMGYGGAAVGPQRDLSQLIEILDNDQLGVDEVRVVPPVDSEDNTDRWIEAKQSAERLRSQLGAQLRQERRPRLEARKRRGSIDSRQLVTATRGANRVFTRTRPGREKNYSCQVILDRSLSMKGYIDMAEEATASLVDALYGLGVEVSILSLYEGRVDLELPFGVDLRTQIDRVLTGRSDGNTPLSDAMAIARQRVDRDSSAVPFIIVVTDGKANEPARYRSQLDRCSCPVFGVYLGEATDDHEPYFDRVVYTTVSDLEVTLGRLAQQMFRRRQ